MSYILLILFLSLISIIYTDNCITGFQYTRITLNLDFSQDLFVGLPNSTYLINVIAIVHNDQYHIIEQGSFASESIRTLILKGDTERLINEINVNHINNTGFPVISYVRQFNGLDGVGNFTFDVITNGDTPLFSFFSYVQDTPDWIVVSLDQLLCTGRETITDLYLWHAGVRDGDGFNNYGDIVLQPVTVLNSTDKFYSKSGRNDVLPPVGSIAINNMESPKCQSSGSKSYKFEFDAQWYIDKYIPYPSNAGFNNILLITHNNSFDLFLLNGYLQKPLIQLFNTKNNESLLTYLNSSSIYKYYYEQDLILPPTGKYTKTIEANETFFYLTYFIQLYNSPDWFIGNSYINLCNSDGWREDIKFHSFILDGGVNSANSFGAKVIPTTPHLFIVKKKSDSDSLVNVDPTFSDLLPIGSVDISETTDDNINMHGILVCVAILIISIVM